MFLTLGIIAVPVEGLGALGEGLKILIVQKGAFEGIGIVLFPGVLAFLMTSSEFALLKRTSVVTLSICGIFKEVVTITAAGIIFDDKLTTINIGGLLVTIASIAAYNYIKITKMRREARAEVVAQTGVSGEAEASEPMLPNDGEALDGIEGVKQASKERNTNTLGRPKPGVKESRPD